MMNFPTSVTTFQVHSNFPTSAKLSNFKRSFPTSLGSFQLCSVLSNFAWLFPTSAKLSNFRLSNLKLSNFSFFQTALSNYTYPLQRYVHDFCQLENWICLFFRHSKYKKISNKFFVPQQRCTWIQTARGKAKNCKLIQIF